MPEELDTPNQGVFSRPLWDYLVHGTPLHPDEIVALGQEPESLAYRMDFAYKDLGVKDLPNSLEVETRISRMKRFAARALMMHETGSRLPEPVAPTARKKTPKKKSGQQG